MKRTIILTLLLNFFLVSNCKAGDNNWVLGVGAQSALITQKGTKSIIDRYNQTRTWLDKEMGYLRPASGLAYSLGWDKGAYTFELGYSRYQATSKASGIAPGTGMEGSRELQLKSNIITFLGQWNFAEYWADHNEVGYGLDMGVTIGGGNYSTRINDGPMEAIRNTGFSNFGMLLGLFYEKPFFGGDTDEGFSFKVMPYVHGISGLGRLDMKPVLQELDPVNSSVPIAEEYSIHRHYGLQVKLLYRIAR